MTDNVYKTIEVTGSSRSSIDNAVQTAVTRSGETLDHLRWFEVTDIRGHIAGGEVDYYQVTLKIGFTIDG